MKQNFFKWVATIICSITPALAESGPQISVGVLLPLTGDASTYGVEAERAMRILQESPGIKGKIQFVLEDGKCGLGHAAVSALQKLLAQNSPAALLIGCSGEVLQTAPITNKEGIPNVCVACSHPGIKSAGEYTFRTYLDVEPGVELIAEYLRRKDFKRIAIITETISFTTAIESSLQAKLGERIVTSDNAAPHEQDLRPLVMKAKVKQPDAVYINVMSPQRYQNTVRALHELGVKAPLFSYYVPGDKSSLEQLQGMQEGVVFFDVPDVAENAMTPKYREFLATYNKKYSQGIESPFLLATAYNAFQAILQAIERVGPDRKLIRDYWASSVIEGATDRFRFDTNGDSIGPRWVLRAIHEGRVALLRDGCFPSADGGEFKSLGSCNSE